MAGKGIEFGIGADTSGFEKAVKNGLIEPLEDAEDALEKLGGSDAGADLAKDLNKPKKALDELGDTKAGKDIENDLEKAQRATKDLSGELESARKDLDKLGYAANGAGDTAKRGMKDAESGVQDFKQEANSTAKEAAASFDGSAESIGDAFQEVAANALGGFGPIGAAAGLALAAGLGIFMQEIDAATKKVEEIQELANDIQVSAFAEGVDVEKYITGLDNVTATLQRMNEEGQKEFRWFWEEDKTGLQEFNDDLRKTGETQATATDILRLGTRDLKKYRDAVEDSRDAIDEELDSLDQRNAQGKIASDQYISESDALLAKKDAIDRNIDALNKEVEIRGESVERDSAWAESGAAAAVARADAEEAASERIKEATSAVQESVLGSYDSMRNAAYEKATADDAAFNTETWITYAAEARVQAETYRANISAMQLTPAEWENFLALPEDARAGISASYASAGEDGKTAIRTALGDGGAGEVGSEATVGFDASFNPKADVEVTVDSSKATEKVEEVSKARTAEVTVKTPGMAEAKSAVEDLIKDRTIKVKVKLDTSAIDDWTPPTKNGRVNVTVDKSAWNDWTPPAKSGRVNAKVWDG